MTGAVSPTRNTAVSTVRIALRFLFNAIAPKPADHVPFQGIPRMIYMHNGPVARSHVFHQVRRYLDIEVRILS
jgi:hypothetical protein